MKYADVIIDNKSAETDNFFTYGCREAIPVVGQRVSVPFGRGNKLRTAYVFRVYEGEEGAVNGLKYIASVDDSVILTEEMLETALFIKRRCFCKTIDAVKCFVPAGGPPKRERKAPPTDAIPERQDIENLTEEQRQALAEIIPSIRERRHRIFLLHGVTGSGKTEVYMRAIEECLRQGRTAIMLVPEIALTKQVIERFFGRFGAENTAVLHSGITSGRRYDEWMRIRRGEARIVIGARSAVFAPLENIGIVVMDEEHETSYKSDMTPKYDTLEVALKRVKSGGGTLLLGSATPSVVSSFRAEKGIYKKIEMKERYNRIELPLVQTVDMRKELLSGNRTIISNALYTDMKLCLERESQVILFLNRRGYAPFISCRECGYVMKCPECGISMTYHKSVGKAVCHYCGRSQAPPELCPECGSRYIRHFGAGTELLEEVICEKFPEAAIARLDADTASKKGSVDKILNGFKRGKTDILIGTQLVAKGLDFRRVGLVGIVAADIALNIPDFRSAERTFQLITQAAGRAGRGDKRGKVIIQSYTPEHYAVRCAATQNYDMFYRKERKIRKALDYPPFGDLIQVIVSAESEAEAEKCAAAFNRILLEAAGSEGGGFLPPRKAPLLKAGGRYRYQMLIKCPSGKRPMYTALLTEAKKRLSGELKKSKALISFDVNPYSLI